VTRICTLAGAEMVAQRGAREIAQHLERARSERGVAHVALSGGTTPGRTHELLAVALADWEGVEVWFADERCVGPKDEQSNHLMVERTLLEHIPGVRPKVWRMEGELGPEQGAERYAQALRDRVAPAEESLPMPHAKTLGPRKGRPRLPEPTGRDVPVLDVVVLDVVVLGIGPDGHVASLFPGAPTLDAGPEAICLGVHDSPKPPPERITLSLAVLRAARRCLLLATGAGKRDAVQATLGPATPHVPASLLRKERLALLLDDAASPPPPLGTSLKAQQSADCGNL
jgi:6-phosphogluconolactonase